MSYIDESLITSFTFALNEHNISNRLMWQDDGACFCAELCDKNVYGVSWRWVPKNLKALSLGTPNSTMTRYKPGCFDRLKAELSMVNNR